MQPVDDRRLSSWRDFVAKMRRGDYTFTALHGSGIADHATAIDSKGGWT
jgi:hypothetical protein